MEGERQSENNGRVAKNTTYLTVALVGQKVLSFLYILLLARLLGVANTGDLFSSISFIGLFSVFIDVGLTQPFIRQTARDRRQGEEDIHSIIAVKMITGIIAAVVMLGLVEYLGSIGRFSTNISFLRLAAIIMIIDSFVITLYGYLRGIERLEYESLGIILHRVAIMLFGIVGLQLGAPPIMSMFALLAGSLSNVAFVTFQLWKRGLSWWPRWNWKPIRRLLILALPFALAHLSSAVYSTSDTILLQIYGGRHDVGLYATAAKIMSAFAQIFPVALVAAIFPAMSSAFTKDPARLSQIFRDSLSYLLIVAMPLSVVITFLAPQIMLLGWGKVWVEAAWPLRVLSIGLLFTFLQYPIGSLLNAVNKQRRNTINIAITVVFNIVANLIFIEQFSYRSVAVISTASAVLLFLLGVYQVRKVIEIPWIELRRVFFKTVLAGGVVALVGWWLLPFAHGRSFSTIAVAAAMGFSYVIMIIWLRLIRREQWQHLLQRIRRA